MPAPAARTAAVGWPRCRHPRHHGRRDENASGLPVLCARPAAAGRHRGGSARHGLQPGDRRARGDRRGLPARQPPHRRTRRGGRQAAQQLWALRAVVGIEDVRIYAPTLKRRAELAEHAATSYGLTATAVETAEEAVREASIVILATTSQTPVIDTSWLAEDCLISTLGPATASGSEIPDDLLTGAYVVTDARDQHLADPAALLPPGGAEAIIPLGQIANNEVRPRTDGCRVYLSRGLAGTEVALLTALADAVDG
ncbi:hypothetical protein [Brevibacterium gallinarum]|uniref:Ornithine cyclodeaminase family protein n=1 Tax=Brevibacterium gallinarum TaxID=2762220 RepID=A0ABR8WRM1_9MICO|nr:hypothetical protein [Brevibacterium gallinarum]MBD8019659.1 hypothetical protein [Brevibacterium gallinarum]